MWSLYRVVAVGRLTLFFALVFSLAALAVPAAHAQATPETPLGSPAERIIAIAQQELARGVYETPMGSNRGKRIRLYGKATQESLRYYPAPWCAYFVSWVTLQAGVPIGWNALGDGYVPRIADWAKRVGLWRRSPKPGDLIVFPQHIGIVESLEPHGLVNTIEGNTSDAVRRRLRLVSSASGFARVSYLTPPVAEVKLSSDPVVRGVPVTLSAANVATPARSIKAYKWDIDGDGVWDRQSTKPDFTFAFQENGNFPVTVSIRDSHRVTATATITVRVVNGGGPR
jgi:hypothetical protein